MAGITSVGIASGIDLEGLINNLIQAEGSPTASRLNAREARIQTSISAFGSLNSSLSQFRSSLANLKDAEQLNTRTATSSDTGYFTASADSNAQAGSYSIQVLNLAQQHKLASTALADPDALVGEGTITLNINGTSTNIVVSATDTLGDLRDKINDSDSGISATLITSAVDPDDVLAGTETRLVLSSEVTGSANEIEILVSDTGDGQDKDNAGLSRFFFSAGDLSNQMSETQEAKDARITVDGFTAISSTNTFNDALDGVTIVAQREPENALSPETETLTVALNLGNTKSQIQEFVDNYNSALSTIRELSLYNPESEIAGPLNGDFTVRSLQSRLRNTISAQVTGTSSISSLAELGITTERDGSLTIDSSTLDDALNDGFEDVSTLFASSEGLATQLDDILGNYLDSGGLISSRTSGFDAQLKRIEEQRSELESRLEKIESSLRSQFIALDQLVGRLQSTGDFLTGQLQTTANIIGSSLKND